MSIQPRIKEGESVRPIWAVLVLGLGAWLMAPQIYDAAMYHSGPDQQNPATQAQQRRSGPETVALGAASAFVGIVALVAASFKLRPGGLARLGISSAVLPKGLLWGLPAACIIVPLTYGMAYLVRFVWDALGLEHPLAHPFLRILQEHSDPALLVTVIVSAVVIAPVFEELLFRGHMQTAIIYTLDRSGRSARSRWIGIVLVSLLFAAVHGELWMMPPIFLLSVCLGYVYERSGNLWTAILIHSAFNASGMAFFLLQKPSR